MFINDKLVNMMTGLGTDRDKSSNSFFDFNYYRQLNKYQIDAMYEGSALAAKVVDLPPDDLTREWRKWNGGPRQIKALQEAERKLKVQWSVNRALKMARLYGGAAILIGIKGTDDPSLPLKPESVGKGDIQYLHALSRFEIWAGAINRDPLSDYFGQPIYYTVASAGTAPAPFANAPVSEKTSAINPNMPTGAMYVHPSRVIRFLGPAKLELARTIDGWGISILNRCFNAIRDAEAAQGNLASLTYEAKVDVIRIPNMTQNVLSEDYRAKLMARFSLANQTKSVQSMLLLDIAEEWDQKKADVGGFPEVLRLFLEVVAGCADIPITRMLGTSAKGLNATGAENTRNYYDSLSSYRDRELQPNLDRLDDFLIRHALGSRPDGLDYAWLPLWQMRENEASAVHLQNAQTNQIYATMGVMPPSAMTKGIQAQLVRDGFYPGLQELLEQAGNEPPAPIAQKQQEIGAEIDAPFARSTPARTGQTRDSG